MRTALARSTMCDDVAVREKKTGSHEACSRNNSQSVSQPAPRSPLLAKLSLGKGWGCKCTRSHVCCLEPVCGLRLAKDERLGTRWCTEPDAQSRMHFIIQTHRLSIRK